MIEFFFGEIMTHRDTHRHNGTQNESYYEF